MSQSGRRVLFGVTLAAAGVIYAVHYQQTFERTDMHKGVLRDKARQASKSKERREAAQLRSSVLSEQVSDSDRLETERKVARLSVMAELEDESRRIVGSEARKGVERR